MLPSPFGHAHWQFTMTQLKLCTNCLFFSDWGQGPVRGGWSSAGPGADPEECWQQWAPFSTFFLAFHLLEGPGATPGLQCQRGDKVLEQPSSRQPLPCHRRPCSLPPRNEGHALPFLSTLRHESQTKSSAERNYFGSIHLSL